MRRPLLYVRQILQWADEHRSRTGRFPERDDGRVDGVFDEKWVNIDQALRIGLRGLPGKWSLAQLLAERRGKRNRKRLPQYSIRQILGWVHTHRRRTGAWPISSSGPIAEAPGETWTAVAIALSHGRRGLPGETSLANLIAEHCGVRNRSRPPRLSVKGILEWADTHKRRTGNWPTGKSGPIRNVKGETWMAIDQALKSGSRGLRGHSSLFKLLASRRGVQRHVRKPPLTVSRILQWADAHYDKHGRWPKVDSGEIPEAHEETWGTVQAALMKGKRGPASTTIAQLLSKHRGVRDVRDFHGCRGSRFSRGPIPTTAGTVAGQAAIRASFRTQAEKRGVASMLH